MSRFAPAEVERQLARVRAACLQLPETSERLSHGGPAFFVRTSSAGGQSGRAAVSAKITAFSGVQGGRPPSTKNTRCFVMFLDDHHDDGRLAIWSAAPEGVQGEMIETDPERFFRPPYVGHLGWLGVELAETSSAELSAICREAFSIVATSTVRRLLDTQRDPRDA
jgi:hypothetical protein